MTDERRHPDALDRQLEALRRAVAPQRDLWPGIASRLGPRAADRGTRGAREGFGHWLPAGAALLAGYLIASWYPLPWGPGLGQPGAEVSVSAPVTLLSSVEPALEQLPAKTRAVVEVDLSGLDQDRMRIEEALAADPDNELLRELQATAESRASSVRERMNRVTATVSEAIEI